MEEEGAGFRECVSKEGFLGESPENRRRERGRGSTSSEVRGDKAAREEARLCALLTRASQVDKERPGRTAQVTAWCAREGPRELPGKFTTQRPPLSRSSRPDLWLTWDRCVFAAGASGLEQQIHFLRLWGFKPKVKVGLTLEDRGLVSPEAALSA